MNKWVLLLCLLGPLRPAFADEPAFFTAGPLTLSVPFKSARATYMYDFNAGKNLVGGETPFITLWNRIEGTLGAVTSLDGQGSPFVGGNILIGNVVDKWLTLPADFNIGGFGGFNFQSKDSMYGLKASAKIW